MSQADKRARDRRHRANRPAWADWYKLPEWRGPNGRRAKQLAAEPWCRFCAERGVKTKADTVDHVERHGGDRFKFFNGPLQSLCRSCHSSAKQAMERNPRPTIGPDGWPITPGGSSKD